MRKRESKQTQAVDSTMLLAGERKANRKLVAYEFVKRNLARGLQAQLSKYDSWFSMAEYDSHTYDAAQARANQEVFVTLMRKAYSESHQRDMTFLEMLYSVSLATLEVVEEGAKGNFEMAERLRELRESHDIATRAMERLKPGELPPPVKTQKPYLSSGYGLNEDTQHAIDSFKRSGDMLAKKKIEEGTLGQKTQRPAMTPARNLGETVIGRKPNHSQPIEDLEDAPTNPAVKLDKP